MSPDTGRVALRCEGGKCFCFVFVLCLSKCQSRRMFKGISPLFFPDTKLGTLSSGGIVCDMQLADCWAVNRDGGWDLV